MRRAPIAMAGFIAFAVAGLAGCAMKPKLPPGQSPRIEVGDPLKSVAWKTVATDADESRLDRIGLAWQEALAEAQKTNPGDIRREGQLLEQRAALPRPAPTPGS